jgi:hypothetical protein
VSNGAPDGVFSAMRSGRNNLQRRSAEMCLAGSFLTGLQRSRMACRKHGALKEMDVHPTGPTESRRNSKKRGVLSKNPESTS